MKHRRARQGLSIAILASLTSCVTNLGEPRQDVHGDGTDPMVGLYETVSGQPLGRLPRVCSTAGTEGLATQLLDEMSCLADGALVPVSHPNVVPTSSRVHLYLSPEGRDALLSVAASRTVRINSALRTIAEQYVLYRGCSVAATPGHSNHETGRAIDVENYASVGSALVRAGFAHPLPSTDPVHYEAQGDDLRSLSVLAFQTLWNANHPSDRIAEDGASGPQVMSRLAQAPGSGFAIDGVCRARHAPTPTPTPAPTPTPTPTPTPSGASCTHTYGGVYSDHACSASYQCCNGTWHARSSGCGTCTCVETTGMTGC
jgi:hypothetical protein